MSTRSALIRDVALLPGFLASLIIQISFTPHLKLKGWAEGGRDQECSPLAAEAHDDVLTSVHVTGCNSLNHEANNIDPQLNQSECAVIVRRCGWGKFSRSRYDPFLFFSSIIFDAHESMFNCLIRSEIVSDSGTKMRAWLSPKKQTMLNLQTWKPLNCFI